MGTGLVCGCLRTDVSLSQQIVRCQPCSVEDSNEAEKSCDPAGVVFDDTTSKLSEHDQSAFRFAGSGNLSALRWLFVSGANPQTVDSCGTSLLHAACRTGSLPVVKDLVRRGVGINAPDNAGWTPLHVAVCMGRQDVAVYLLQHGAKPDAVNLRGQIPGDLCSHRNTKEVVGKYKLDGVPNLSYPTRAEEPDDNSWLNARSALEFEPFFVPRDPVLPASAYSDELNFLGLELFNKSPGHGISFLVAVGSIRDYPVEINDFLVRLGASPQSIGEFLGEEFPIAQTLRLEFLNSMPFLGTGVVGALEVAFSDMAVPQSLTKVDHLVRGIAHFWWRQHEAELGRNVEVEIASCSRDEVAGLHLFRSLSSTDTLHRLMFSTLMLQRRMQGRHHVTLRQWIELNTGIEGVGKDVPVHVQTSIYQSLTKQCLEISDKSAPPSWLIVPSVEGWASVHYKIRMGNPFSVSPVSPRMLAEQGGVARSGCSADATAPLKGNKNSLASDRPPGEVTWLRLHSSLLLLSTGHYPPYAFVSLKQICKWRREETQRKITFSCNGSTLSSQAEWLKVCILLCDGRFQQLEVESFEIQFETGEQFVEWSVMLGDAGRVKRAELSGDTATPWSTKTLKACRAEVNKCVDPEEHVPLAGVRSRHL